MGEVKVLGTVSSPYTLRARIGLNIKSVEYEFMVEPMRPKSELLLKSNPVHKKVPVLFHHDKILCESSVIVHYIDEVWSSGPSILPSDPYDRAIHRFWTAYIDDKWWPSLFGVAQARGDEAKRAAAAEQVKAGLTLLEDAFGKSSKGKPFFGGDNIEFLDITLGCFLAWMKATEKMSNAKLFDEATTPALFAWDDRFCAADAVKDVVPDVEKLAEFITMLVNIS